MTLADVRKRIEKEHELERQRRWNDFEEYKRKHPPREGKGK